jgi:drug/metabolite transporter superfamily protein YnfA
MLSILCGWQVDRIVPDKFDLIGGFILPVGCSACLGSFTQFLPELQALDGPRPS